MDELSGDNLTDLITENSVNRNQRIVVVEGPLLTYSFHPFTYLLIVHPRSAKEGVVFPLPLHFYANFFTYIAVFLMRFLIAV